MSNEHSTDQQLKDFVLFRLTIEEEVLVDQHIQRCRWCSDRLHFMRATPHEQAPVRALRAHA